MLSFDFNVQSDEFSCCEFSYSSYLKELEKNLKKALKEINADKERLRNFYIENQNNEMGIFLRDYYSILTLRDFQVMCAGFYLGN